MFSRGRGEGGGRISETTSVSVGRSVGRSRSVSPFFLSSLRFGAEKKVEKREEKAPSVGKKLAVGTAAPLSLSLAPQRERQSRIAGDGRRMTSEHGCGDVRETGSGPDRVRKMKPAKFSPVTPLYWKSSAGRKICRRHQPAPLPPCFELLTRGEEERRREKKRREREHEKNACNIYDSPNSSSPLSLRFSSAAPIRAFSVAGFMNLRRHSSEAQRCK